MFSKNLRRIRKKIRVENSIYQGTLKYYDNCPPKDNNQYETDDQVRITKNK